MRSPRLVDDELWELIAPLLPPRARRYRNPGRRRRSAYSQLSLACGRATSEYLWPRDGRIREVPVSGGEWSPPCVAVPRLRRAVFSPPLNEC
jgi:transposase